MSEISVPELVSPTDPVRGTVPDEPESGTTTSDTDSHGVVSLELSPGSSPGDPPDELSALKIRQREVQDLINTRVNELFELKHLSGDFEVKITQSGEELELSANEKGGQSPAVQTRTTSLPNGMNKHEIIRVLPADHPDLDALYAENVLLLGQIHRLNPDFAGVSGAR